MIIKIDDKNIKQIISKSNISHNTSTTLNVITSVRFKIDCDTLPISFKQALKFVMSVFGKK